MINKVCPELGVNLTPGGITLNLIRLKQTAQGQKYKAKAVTAPQ